MDASLKLIKQQLQNILKRFDWNAENIISQGQTVSIKLSGLANIRSVINDIKTLNLFDAVVLSLSNSVIFTTANDQMNVQTQEGQGIVASLTLLKTLSTIF